MVRCKFFFDKQYGENPFRGCNFSFIPFSLYSGQEANTESLVAFGLERTNPFFQHSLNHLWTL